jgi:hypothetical protein
MWIVNLLPTWVFTLSIIIGVFGIIATFLVKFIPFLYRYVVLLQIAFIVLLVFGIYFKGAADTNDKWQARVEELEAKVVVAEEKARTATSKVEYVFLDRVQKVKDVQVVIQEKLKEVTVNIDSKCKVAPEALGLVNSAARNTIEAVK